MTGYTVHTGSNEKFTKGWDGIFGASAQSAPATEKSTTSRSKSGERKTSKTGTAPVESTADSLETPPPSTKGKSTRKKK